MLNTFFERLVRVCRSKPLAATALIVLLTAGALFGAVRTLGMNTDSLALFDTGLGFRAAEAEFDAQFPAETELIVAVIDGPSAPEAQAAADRLAAKLAPRSDLFHSARNPTGGEFFAKNGLLFLGTDEIEALSTELARAQPFLGAIATDRSARGMFRLFDLAFTAAAEGETAAAAIAPAATQAADVIEKIAAGQPASMNWAGLFTSLAPAGDGKRAMVLAQPKLDLSALEQGGAATAFMREAIEELGLTPANGYRVRLTGQVPLNDEELATVAEGTGISGIVSVVLVTILLFMALGSGRIVGAALLTLVAGLILTLGWAAMTVGELNLISVAFAVMFVGIAVDFSIQFCMRYRAERHARGADSLNPSLDAAGFAMAKPLTLAAATTSLGFFSFLPTDYRGVSQLGFIAGGGMIIAMLLSFTLLPALLRLFRTGGEQAEIGYRWAAPLNQMLVAKRIPVLAAAVLLAVVSIAALPRLIFDFDPLKLKDPNTESMSTALELMDDPLINPNALNVLTKSAEDAKALAEKLSALPEVSHAITIFDVIPADQDVKLTMIEDLGFLMGPVFQPGDAKPAPGVDEIMAAAKAARGRATAYLASPAAAEPLRAAAQRLADAIGRLQAKAEPALLDQLSTTLLNGFDAAIAPLNDVLGASAVTFENIPADLRDTFISKDGRYRVQVFPKATGSDADELTPFLKAVQTVAPTAIGAPLIIYESGRIVTGAFRTAALLALAAITLVLFVVLRRPGDVARVLAPLLLAGILTLGTAALTGLAINFANIIALPLLLGVGVTFPIYFVTAWREGEDTLLASPAGRGMLYSALTTAAAFGSLAISTHTGTASMGILLTMALAYTLLATLIVLPALLGPSPRRN